MGARVCKVCGAAGPAFCAGCRARYGGMVVRVERSSPRPRERVYASAVRTRKGVERPVKRGCASGRFFPRARRALGCAFKPHAKAPPWWVARRGDRTDTPCYRSRGELLRAFVAWNVATIEAWGGLDQPGSRGEFDAVNERHELRGRRRVTTLREAIERAAPRGGPWCLDRLDVGMLNETAPAVHGRPFELPAVEQEWDYGPPPESSSEVPF